MPSLSFDSTSLSKPNVTSQKFYLLGILVFGCPSTLYLPLVVITDHHWTQRVTFDTKDTSDIWSERCLDKKTKRQNRQKKKTKLQKENKKKDKKKEEKKDKRPRPKRVWYCDVRAVSHSCDICVVIQEKGRWHKKKAELGKDVRNITYCCNCFNVQWRWAEIFN